MLWELSWHNLYMELLTIPDPSENDDNSDEVKSKDEEEEFLNKIL